MSAMSDPSRFSEASLSCRGALGTELVSTSLTAGWTSILLEHHRLSYAGSLTFDTHPTPDQTIVVMLKGEQDIEVFRNGAWRRARYQTGTIGMTPGDTVGRLRRRIRGNASAEKLNLYVPRSVFDAAADRYRGAGQRCAEKPMTALAFDDPLVAGTVRALFEAMRHGAPDLYAETAVHWLAAHLLSAHRGWFELGQGSRTDTMVAGRIARVVDLMTERFGEPLSLAQLSQEAGVSQFHFARLFRARTGRSPHGFLIALRMNEAQRLLTDTDLQIAEVARRCGYSSPAHFAAAFARCFGHPPSVTRRNSSRQTDRSRSTVCHGDD